MLIKGILDAYYIKIEINAVLVIKDHLFIIILDTAYKKIDDKLTKKKRWRI